MYANRSSTPRPLSLSLARFGSAAAVCAALSLASAHHASAAPAAWDVDGLTNGVITSGSGTWADGGTANFTDLADTIAHFAWSNAGNAGDTVVFGGTGGVAPFTITIAAGGISAGGLQFDTLGYTLTGGALNLGNAATITTNVDAEIHSVIAGIGLTSSGAGSLLLRGANTFTGQYAIGSGTTVIAGNGAALGASGATNETLVSAGGTLDVGGQNLSAERIHIAGTGDSGLGALTNSGAGQNNATALVTLTGHATVNAQGQLGLTAGSGTTTSYGRFDIRAASYAANAQNLNLGTFTLTKIGRNQFSLVNAEVVADITTPGNIAVNEGLLSIEADTRFVGGASSITVNPGGRLGFFSIVGSAVLPNITVAGGSLGDTAATSAAQTITSNVAFTSAAGELWANSTAGTAFSGVVSGTIGGGVTGIAKRGAGSITLSNAANTFDAPLTVYQGTLQANYTTAVTGGATPGAPAVASGTPLGTASTITLAGGTLNIRVDGSNDTTTNNQISIDKGLVVDRAPSVINLDRLTASGGQNKIIVVNSLTFAAPSAANGYAIGQNQLGVTQTNGFRLQVQGATTMNSDTVFNVGDITALGGVNAGPGGWSLAHQGGNTYNVLGAASTYRALFNLGQNSTVRVGSGFGTTLTDNTVTAGTGPIFLSPLAVAGFRTPTNLAAGQTVELVSQRVAQATINLEQFTAVPAAVRALGGGVLGVGNATAFGDLDLSTIGDGTFRIGAGFSGSGAGTITGVIKPGAGGVVRMGAGNTVTVSGANRITGSASLEVGSPLINGGFQTAANNTAQNGTVVLTGANNFAGGAVVNRASTLSVQAVNALGTGSVEAFGTLSLSGANGSLVSGGANTNAVNLHSGSTLAFDSNGLAAGTTVNRWNDTTAIDLRSAGLLFASPNPGVYNVSEVVGAVTFDGGSTLTMNRSGTTVNGQQMTLSLGSLARTGTGTLELVRNGGTGAGFGSGQIVTVAAGAPSVLNGMVAPHFAINGVTEQSSFATYGGSGFLPIVVPQTVPVANQFDAVVTAAAFNAGLTAGTEKVYVDFSSGATTTALGYNPVIYAMKVGAGTAGTTIATGGGNAITLRSGGLVISGDSSTTAGGAVATSFSTAAGTATIAPNLVFNNGTANIEAMIYARSGYTGMLNGTITANGLTKFGAGTLNLTANNGATLAGNVTVNQGTLQLFGPTATGTYNVGGTSSVVLAGGQLNLRSNNSAVTGTINPTMQMGLTVAENIPIATLDVNRSGADTASSGTFIFNPAAASSPGLRLLGAPGTQGQTLNITGANYAVQFGNNAANTIVGNVTINNAVTLTTNANLTISGTNPVITKAGAGTWITGVAGGTLPVVPGAKLVVNAGTLEMRSVLSFGTGGTGGTTVELNGGTLNLRRDSAGSYGGLGSGTAYNVTVNGSTTISTDRAGGTVSNYAIRIGALTINGNPTVNFTGANGVYGEFFSGGTGVSMQLNGLPFLNSTMGPGTTEAAMRLNGTVNGGGFVKGGTGHMHLLGLNTYDGGTWINQGIVRARGSSSLGSGVVTVNPGGIIDFNSTGNMNSGQPLIVRGNSSFIPMISMNTDNAHPTTDVDTTAAPVGIIGLSNTTAGIYDTPIDMAALYGGNWYLGGISSGAYDARYTAETLGVGAGNTYRLGGGGLAFVASVDSANNPRNNLLTGSARVVYGFDSGNLRGANATTFQFVTAGTQNYGGGTLINRGTVMRLVSANDGTFSGLSVTTADVFGNLALGTNASLATAGGLSTNNVVLHPGSALHFDNNNTGGQFGAVNNIDRWGDNTPIALNGALLDLVGNLDNISTETVGALTYSRGARIRVGKNGTGTATLTLASLAAAAGNGHTLTLQSSAANLLGSPAGDRILVAGTPPALTNNMASPGIVNGTDNTFVTYTASNGFVNVTYDKTLNATYSIGSLLPTDKVDVGTAALVLADNPTVYALRTNQNINVSGANSTITIRSGGLIGTTNTITIQPKLVFNDGTANVEARIYNSSTVNINGAISANGVTKFGTGNLSINVAQPDYASGWTVNAGTLQINDLGGLGQSVPGNAVTLNATQTTSGSAGQQLGITNLTFARNTGSPELGVFSGGPITVVNEGTIRVAAGDDRNLQIPNVTLQSTGSGINSSSVGFTFDVPNNRYRATIPTLTLASDATVRVFDSGATTDTGRVTAGVVNSLAGTNVMLNKIGNRTLELAGDNSATFTGGSIVVGQGTVRVLHNGSLGSATTAATIERNATLEIGVANFASIATLNQLPGSIERWNLETARPSIYTLPAGVNLQLNTNLLGAHTIGLNGGSIEGFLWIDHPNAAVQRTVGSSVSINLLADSFVGQNVLQGFGYDLGRQPTVTGPFSDNVTGSYLRIDGSIGGAFNLTKTGLDTVTLGSNSNSYNNTLVDMGTLRIGVDNALPVLRTLTTRYAGAFDLYGFNQFVAGLGTSDIAPNPGAVSVGSSGRIVNSATTISTLTVSNTDDYTYNGVIDRTVSLVKTGSGILTIAGANTHSGDTKVSDGTLRTAVSKTLSPNSVLHMNGGTVELFSTDQTVAGLKGATGAIQNGGALTVDQDIDTTYSGAITGATTLIKAGDGSLTLNGLQDYPLLIANDGTTNVDSALGTGTSAIAANTGSVVNIRVSQTLASLTIADGATVTLTTLPGPGEEEALGSPVAGIDSPVIVSDPTDALTASSAPGSSGDIAAVPEPGSLGLLAVGALGLLRRRGKAAGAAAA